ncbi:VTT domain-containing protein [Natronomonas salina]|uniref:DedA family protein n=1 Tax=Natronomonas salina TaxID=1710540 RepID=UPI0015B5CE7E|nr:VTT domain-containing protein [Natronomonas salina]QLD88904.1 VTT domain-containing protein [Natronomonas salina]
MAHGTPTGTERLGRFFERYAVYLAGGVTLACAAVGIYLFLFADSEYAARLLDRYGLAALFCILVLEGAMLLYFAPSEALVPAGIALLTGGAGDYVGIATVIGVAVLGATVGQYALFTVAKRAGREYLLEQSWFRVSRDQLERFDGWFDRWGPLAVPVSNSLLFTRGMLTVPAGLADMDDRTFVALSALGSVIFQSWLAGFALLLDVRFGVL